MFTCQANDCKLWKLCQSKNDVFDGIKLNAHMSIIMRGYVDMSNIIQLSLFLAYCGIPEIWYLPTPKVTADVLSI